MNERSPDSLAIEIAEIRKDVQFLMEWRSEVKGQWLKQEEYHQAQTRWAVSLLVTIILGFLTLYFKVH